jgi:hypothetical protein
MVHITRSQTAAARWAHGSLDDPDAVGTNDLGAGELSVAVADEELDRVCFLEIWGLLGHPVGDRVDRDACDADEAGVVVDEDKHVKPFEHTVSTLKKSHAINPFAWALISAQLGRDLHGEGLLLLRFKIAQTLDAAIVMPMLASSP